MGMYALIEDAMNKRFDELLASGMTEDEAADAMREEEEQKNGNDREPADGY